MKPDYNIHTDLKQKKNAGKNITPLRHCLLFYKYKNEIRLSGCNQQSMLLLLSCQTYHHLLPEFRGYVHLHPKNSRNDKIFDAELVVALFV